MVVMVINLAQVPAVTITAEVAAVLVQQVETHLIPVTVVLLDLEETELPHLLL